MTDYNIDYIPDWIFYDCKIAPTKLNPADYRVKNFIFPCDSPNIFYSLETWRKINHQTKILENLLLAIGKTYSHIPTSPFENYKWIQLCQSHQFYEIPFVIPYTLGLIIYRNQFEKFYLTRGAVRTTGYLNFKCMKEILTEILKFGNMDKYNLKYPISKEPKLCMSLFE